MTMLAYQVDYWKLQEQKRTNRANEAIGWTNAEVNQQNADTNRLNYFVNAQNADTNARNADINAYNAETNRLNYGVNVQNAQSNRMQAQAALQNADSNRMNAYTNRFNYGINARELGIRQAAQDLAENKFELEKYYKPAEMRNNYLSAMGSYNRGLANKQLAPSQEQANIAKAERDQMGKWLDLTKTVTDTAETISSEIREWNKYKNSNKQTTPSSNSKWEYVEKLWRKTN